MRTSCGDVSISDDGTARIEAIYGNTVDGKNMMVNAIETVGFNLFGTEDYEGLTTTYDGKECIYISGTATGTKLIVDKAYLGLGQLEFIVNVYRGASQYPRLIVAYTDGTQG